MTRQVFPLLVVILSWMVGTPSAGAKPQILEMRVGFNGVHKLGCWTPVEVDLSSTDESYTGRIVITAPDSDAVPTSVISPSDRPVGVDPGPLTTARLFVRVGQSQSWLRAQFVVDGKVLTERTFYPGPESSGQTIRGGVPATNRLLVQYGPPLGLGELVRESQLASDLTSTLVTRLEQAEDLPARWFGYEGVEMVLLTTSEVELYRPLQQNAARIEALRQWVERGGKLVIFCGGQAEELLGEGGVLAGLVPGDFDAMAPLRQSLTLETYSGSADAITSDRRLDLQVPQLTNLRGQVLVHAGRDKTDLPLVVRGRLGFGEVLFLGLDFDQPPLRDWPGRAEFLRRVFDWPAQEAAERQQTSQGAMEANDMVGLLRNALDSQFSNVTTIPFALVGALVIGYILLVGPGDYLLVTRILRRAELTWITFPLMVVAVSAGAYWFANWMKGDQLRVNQVEIVDVDATTGRAQGTLWTHFFSPRVDQYDLSIQPKLLGADAPASTARLVSWLGLPGYAQGGMQAAGAQTSIFDRGYTFREDLSAMQDIPVQLWSTKTITARWEAPLTSPVESRLRRAGEEMIQGQIVNGSSLGFEDGLLLHGSWAYYLGRIAPEGPMTIDDQLQPRTIKTMLTSATAGDATEQRTAADGTVPFQWAAGDVARLVKAMMFFEAINGEKYTRSLNRYQATIDFSHLLRQEDVAVLLARTSSAGSQWLDNDQPLASDADRRWTYYRFVLPVDGADP